MTLLMLRTWAREYHEASGAKWLELVLPYDVFESLREELRMAHWPLSPVRTAYIVLPLDECRVRVVRG